MSRVPALPTTAVRGIEQRVARDLIAMVKRHKALNEQEQRLMEAICAEVGVKYNVLPPQEGFKAERLEESIPENWF